MSIRDGIGFFFISLSLSFTVIAIISIEILVWKNVRKGRWSNSWRIDFKSDASELRGEEETWSEKCCSGVWLKKKVVRICIKYIMARPEGRRVSFREH